MEENIKYRRIGVNGFGRINGVSMWITAPTDSHSDWAWEVVKYDGEYASGIPRLVTGIGTITGRAGKEKDAILMAEAAVELVGAMPDAIARVDLDCPIEYRLAVAE